MNYKNGKIYKIINAVNDKIYIGSTTQPLFKRFYHHKHSSKTNSKIYLYKAIEEIGIEKFKIVLIEEYPCENKEQLIAREQYHIDLYNSTKNGYNNRYAQRSDSKYRLDNKIIINEKIKEYKNKNKEKIKQQSKEYYELNKEKIKKYAEKNKEKFLKRKKEKY